MFGVFAICILWFLFDCCFYKIIYLHFAESYVVVLLQIINIMITEDIILFVIACCYATQLLTILAANKF